MWVQVQDEAKRGRLYRALELIRMAAHSGNEVAVYAMFFFESDYSWWIKDDSDYSQSTIA